MTQEQKERLARIGFASFAKAYNAEKDYVKVTETNPNADKHMYELIWYKLNDVDYSLSRTVYVFRSSKEMTYAQFKDELKTKYKLEIPDKRKLIAKNTKVAAYAISDKRVFYVGATAQTQNRMQDCMELMNNDYIVKEYDYYEYTSVHEYNSGIKEGKTLKPLLKECGNEDVNAFYKFDYDDKTYYALKDKVDRFFVDFPAIAQKCYPYNEQIEFVTYSV